MRISPTPATSLSSSREWETGQLPTSHSAGDVPLLFWHRFDTSRGLWGRWGRWDCDLRGWDRGRTATSRLCRLHEHLRILFQLLLHTGVSLQILLKLGMPLLVVLVIGQPGVLRKFLGDAAMAAEEFTEASPVPVRHVAIAVVLNPVETLLLAHETVRVLADFLASSRMLLQVLLQRGVVTDKILVFRQRGIPAKLLGDFGMSVHEAIKARQLPTSRVVVATVLVALTLRPIEITPILVAPTLRLIGITPILAPIIALFLVHE